MTVNEANDIPEEHYSTCLIVIASAAREPRLSNFQSCWDGVNLYIPNPAHVAYLSGFDYGVGSPSHPVPIPRLFFE